MKILLIDDDESLRTAMADFFLGRGYWVQCAAEAEEAIAMVKHHRYDAVIVDLELNSIEGLDGFSVLKASRQSSPRTKVVVYSGHSSPMIMEAALRHGGTKFIPKPASFKQLIAGVEELCPLPC